MAIAMALTLAAGLAGCAAPALRGGYATVERGGADIPLDPAPEPVPSPTPSPTPAPAPTTTKPKPTTARTTASGGLAADGVPALGTGTFTPAPGGTPVVGTGATLITYRIEVEDGITWGSNEVWSPERFAEAADTILAEPHGWTASAQTPITDASQHMTNASWSFQRVSGAGYSVRVLLATPGTVDKMCGSIGLKTNGQYSCRYGQVILINLRRWLKGAPGFPIDLTGYHTMVINHEMGHRLGFKHMLCGGKGMLAPVMMQETIDIGGCLPNAYPFAPDGTFVSGPWTA